MSQLSKEEFQDTSRNQNKLPDQIILVSHSNLFYWWPVWAVGFVLAGIAFAIWRKRQFRGQVILVVAVLYGIWRFLIEYVRDDPERLARLYETLAGEQPER